MDQVLEKRFSSVIDTDHKFRREVLAKGILGARSTFSQCLAFNLQQLSIIFNLQTKLCFAALSPTETMLFSQFL